MKTRDKIILAAIEVFAKKGKHGTTMDEIAIKAKINKAMIYYFFHNKENLFKKVLSFVLDKMFAQVFKEMEKQIENTQDPVEKIKLFIESHFEAFSINSDYTNIIFATMSDNAGDLKKIINEIRVKHFNSKAKYCFIKKAVALIDDGIIKGIFRKVDPRQILINIIALSTTVLITKPIAQSFLDFDLKGRHSLNIKRHESLTDLLLYGIISKRGYK